MRTIITTFLTTLAIVFGLALIYSASARADELVIVCPDGHTGVAQGQTSCAFAQNVRMAYWASGANPAVVQAYSPVTGEIYTMQCSGGFMIRLSTSPNMLTSSARCVGGNNAVVWAW